MNLYMLNESELAHFLEVAQTGNVYGGEWLALQMLQGMAANDATNHLYAFIVGHTVRQLEERRLMYGVILDPHAPDIDALKADFDRREKQLRNWSAFYHFDLKQVNLYATYIKIHRAQKTLLAARRAGRAQLLSALERVELAHT